MSTTLRLSDVLGRGVSIEWFEAVALVSEVADRVRDSVGGRGIPELDQIQLAADGTISITGAMKTDEPIRRLGQLLQACLAQTDPPVQLRLAVAQATAPEPGYGSIRQFSEALAYFERPDRPAVLMALHAKAASAPETPPVAALTLDTIAPLETVKAPQHREPERLSRPAPRRAVVGMVAVVVLVAAATAYSQFNSPGQVGTEVSELAVKATDAVGTTLVKGISAVSDSVGLGRLAPAEGSGAPAPAAPPVQPAVRTTQARSGGAPSAAPTSFRVFDLPAARLEVGTPAALPASDVPASIPPVAPLGVAPPDATIYTADDPTVSAPIGLRPQLPNVLPDDVRQEQLSQIELIVLPDGTVGSVKLLGERRSVLEGMLLSAAKAWTFKPAQKDGRPVSFRKIVWLVRD